MSAAARLSVDRLTLDVGTATAAESERLAQLVCEALRRWPAAPPGSARLGHLTADVAPAAAGEPLEHFAERIGRAVLMAALRELRP